MQLSFNFALEEFLISQTAARRGRVIEATPAEVENLRRLCQYVLQPLRQSLGAPIVITSGLRPAWLNAAVGGSHKSAHVAGRAADIQVPGFSPVEVCAHIHDLGLPVDQCIHEFPPNGWTHVSIAAQGTAPRVQFLTAYAIDDGRSIRTDYKIGIHA